MTMFQIGDRIVYGNNGICSVERIDVPDFQTFERGKQYYFLRCEEDNSRIYAPVDTCLPMRKIMTQEEAAARVGKSRSSVANVLRLLKLCPAVRAMVQDGRLSGGHARTLLPLGDELQQSAAETVLKGGLSVRQTEALVKKLTTEKKEKPTPDGVVVNYAEEAARELSNSLNRGCRIIAGKKKGRIELEYYDMDDLNDLLDALHTLKKKK